MAVKNVYKDFIKFILKHDKVRLQRVGDSVYITDSYAVLKVPYFDYHNLIRPLDYGAFIELNDGDEAMRDKGEKLSVKSDLGSLLKDTYDKIKPTKPAVVTDFCMKVKRAYGDIRFLIADGLYVGVDDNYISGAKNFIPDFFVGDKWMQPIKGELGDVGVAICPIRYDMNELDFFRKGKE